MKVTVLMENTASDGLACEHGLSLYIEHEGMRYLLDAGASDALVENAKRLGIDLTQVDVAILSHGHYDHSGGFPAFFDLNAQAPLYLRTQAEEETCRTDGAYIGVPKRLLERRDRLHPVAGREILAPGVFLLPHSTPGLEQRGETAHLFRRTAEGIVPDDFSHEQTLIFTTPAGLVLFSSCSHAGADTVTLEAMDAFPGLPIRAFFGGFHLMGLGGDATLGVCPEEVEALGRRLLALGVEEIWTGHCTGAPAFALLKPILGDRLHALSSGVTVKI